MKKSWISKSCSLFSAEADLSPSSRWRRREDAKTRRREKVEFHCIYTNNAKAVTFVTHVDDFGVEWGIRIGRKLKQ